MRLELATTDHFDTVVSLIDEASAWLRTKGPNQWAAPWPDRNGRDARVLRGLARGKTWIAWDGGTAAATVTLAARPNLKVWSRPGCVCDLSERAVYAHRLITARSHAGSGLGAQLIDWAGLQARGEYGARWIRIDVWSTNIALHKYYLGTGFEACGSCDDPDYPSGRLFQKRTALIEAAGIPLLRPPAPSRQELIPA
jgi:GNAT superfamily N-acetyltransferase